MAESTDLTVLPDSTSIEDGDGAIWTFRYSDRALLKNGVHSGISNVLQTWYINHVVWAFKGTHWRKWNAGSGRWQDRGAMFDTGLETAFPGVKQCFFPTMPPPGFRTTAGLRGTTGVLTLASHAGVSLPTGTNPQTIIDANPAGTTYVFAAGTHTSRSIVPKAGDNFFGLTGAILDGASNTTYAFSGGAPYVVVENLTIKNYTAPVQRGMIERMGPYLLVKNCDMFGCTGGGAVNVLDFALVTSCKLHDNNEQAYSVHGDTFNNFVAIHGVLFDNCEMYLNNPTGDQQDGSEQGGGKALETLELTFWFCWNYDNQGSDFWSDYNNQRTLYWADKCGYPGSYAWNGVEHEISQTCKILYCTFIDIQAGPGGLAGFLSCAAIFIGNSGGTNGGVSEFAHCSITCHQYSRAITGRMQNRSIQDRQGVTGEPRWIENTYVHNNAIDVSPATSVTNGHVGIQADNGSDIIFYGDGVHKRIEFDYNAYTMGTIYNPFVWGSPGMGISQWQSFGQDLHSTFDFTPETPGLSAINKNSHASLSGTPKLVATSDGSSSAAPGRTTDDFIIEAGDKKYWEVVITFENGSNRVGVGFCNASEGFGDNEYIGSGLNGVGFYCFTGEVYMNGAVIANLASYVISQTVCIAYHGGVGYWFRVDGGNWNNNPSANPATGVGALDASSFGDVYPAYSVSVNGIVTFRLTTGFGQSIPSGFSGF